MYASHCGNVNASIQSSSSVTDSLSAELMITLTKEALAVLDGRVWHMHKKVRHEYNIKLDDIAQRQNRQIEALKNGVMDHKIRLKQQLAATKDVANKTEKMQDVLKRKIDENRP